MFYTFRQNNSRGVFDRDAHVDEFVIVEGDTIEQVTDRAQDIGVYFNGCDRGLDCDCCGDRWYAPYEGDDELDEVPSTYGQPLKKIKSKRTKGCNVIIHYADGKVMYGTNPNSIFKN